MNTMKYLFGMLLLFSACEAENDNITDSGLEVEKFKTEVSGKPTGLYVLKNSNNMEVCITNFGGRIVSVMVPDKDGGMKDVVLGFDSITDYIKYPTDFGATIGRYANRINKGRFVLDGNEYVLPRNNFGHCLHGGPNGFQYQVFDARQLSATELQLSYMSKDGEEGFPGNLHCDVYMKLTDENAIEISYSAKADAPTIVNMTNHSYFNLDGDASLGNGDYYLYVNADSFTPVDSTFMTTGEIADVENTPFDFRNPVQLKERFLMNDEQLDNGKGIDHNWILNTGGNIEECCASLYSERSGIALEVYTTEPGIQVYTGNFLDGSLIGKKGVVYNHHASVCLETQHYPDSPNKNEWPSVVLRSGETYNSKCIYKFSVRN